MFLQPHNANTRPRAYTELLPVFSVSPHSLSADILVPPGDQFDINEPDTLAWEDKEDKRLGWRGSTTGMSQED